MNDRPNNDRPNQENTTASRRNFLKTTGAVTAGALAGSLLPESAAAAPASLPSIPFNPATAGAMPTRNLGRTGHRPGIFSLGGQASIEQPNNEAVAIPIIERALDLGVNYVDTAAAYGGKDRWSQRYVGQVMKHRRSQVYLASKTHDRTRDGSLALLEESLRLLNTDHLDAWRRDRSLRSRPADGVPPPLRLRSDPDGSQRRRCAPPQLQRAPAAHGRGQADGYHRNEDSCPRPHPQLLAARQESRLRLEPASF